MSLVLYHLDVCPYCEKVRLALEIDGTPWESKPVGRDDREEVREASGQDSVPVLVDGDTVLTESNLILDHLAGRPGSKLLPEGRRARTLTRMFVTHADGTVAPLCTRIKRGTGENGEPLLPEDVVLLRRRLDHELDTVDGALEGRPFLFGDRPTVADIAYHAFLNRVDAAGKLQLPESLPRIRAWYDRVRVAAGR